MSHAAATAGHGHGDSHHEEMGHVSPLYQLFAVFAALLVLTAITVYVSRGPYDLGWMSVFVAIIVATIKAMLVMLFFMHLYYDRRFNMVAFFSGYIFLALFLFFAMLDSGQYQRDIKVFQESNPPAATTTAAPATGS